MSSSTLEVSRNADVSGKKFTNIGLVGARNIGKHHLRSACKLSGVRVVAVADQDEASLEEVRKEFQGTRCYRQASELFADPQVEAVILAVPNHLHAPLSIQAMEAGKDVLVEKPVARNSAEALQMIAVRDRTRRTLMVGMNQRFHPSFYALREQIQDGAIGKIQYVRTRWLLKYASGIWGRGSWGLSRESSGGGALLDIGVHRLDLALWVMGFPQVASVTAALSAGIGCREGKALGKDYRLEDLGVVLIRFSDGRVLHLEASYFINDPDPEPMKTTFHGESGCGVLTENSSQLFIQEGQNLVERSLASAKWPSSCVEHFADVLAGKSTLSPTAEEAVVSLKIIEAAYESADSGKTIYF